MSDEQVILLDCDGVIVDSHPKFMRLINEKFGTSFTMASIVNYKYEECLGKAISDYILEELWHLEDLYDDEPVTIPVKDMIRSLRGLGRVILISAPMAGHATSKMRFLHRAGFAQEEIVFTWDKAALERAFPGALLIDDSPSFLKRHQGPKIIFNQPYNQGLESELMDCLRAYSHSSVYWLAIDLLHPEHPQALPLANI